MHAPVVPSRGSSNQQPMSFDDELLVHPDHAPERARSDSTGSAGRANSLASHQSYMTEATDEQPSVILAPLQEKPVSQGRNDFDPLEDEDEASYDLVSAPVNPLSHGPSVERRSKQLISHEHLRAIFDEPTLFRHFVGFLSKHRRPSLPLLIYYLDAVKSLKAIAYANSLAFNLDVITSLDFTQSNPEPAVSRTLQEKADKAFDVMVREDLPAYVAHIYVQVVSPSISKRIAGTLEPHLQEASEGLAEVFCLTDPSREDNPIVFASEEFNRTTQYGMNYIVGRNCRFLQGPETDRATVCRLRAALDAGKESCEVVLNYRRDGSPFLNLLMMAPLTDSRGRLRYFIGAQIDVSGLVKQGTDLDALNKILQKEREDAQPKSEIKSKKDDFESLCELFNHTELKTVSTAGGRIYRDDTPPSSAGRPQTDLTAASDDEEEDEVGDGLITGRAPSHKPRLLLREASSDEDDVARSSHTRLPSASSLSSNGRLGGVFQQYLLVRPYPSLRILFTSPSLRVPGILQSPLTSRIGGSARVRDNLTAALAEGRGVTAKVKWVTRFDADGGGRSRYLHFTPLIGINGQIGVWMVVMVDPEREPPKDKESGEIATTSQPRRMAPVVMSSGEMASRNAPSIRREKALMETRTPRSAALRREEATAGGSTRGSSRDGSALSVRL